MIVSDFSVIRNAEDTLIEVGVVCHVHGRSVAASVFGREPRCLKCISESVVADTQASISRIEVEGVRRKVGGMMMRSGIPARYRDATFDRYVIRDNPDQASVVSAVRMFAASDAISWRSLVLFGSPGTGKTHLAVAAMIEMMSRGRTAKYISCPNLVDRFLRSRSFSSGVTREEILAEMVVPDILVIDEIGLVGSVGVDDQMLATIYDVVNARYNEMRPIIVCSNGTPSEMRMVLGDRVVERLRENGGRILKMDWVSYRKDGGT